MTVHRAWITILLVRAKLRLALTFSIRCLNMIVFERTKWQNDNISLVGNLTLRLYSCADATGKCVP
jgi:hypothetical protein